MATTVASQTVKTFMYFYVGYNTTSGFRQAMKWTATETFGLSQIQAYLSRVGVSHDGDFWFEVWDDDGGEPGTIIANGTSSTKDPSTFAAPNTGDTYTFTFATQPTLSNGSTYYFVASFDYTVSTDDYVRWWGDDGASPGDFRLWTIRDGTTPVVQSTDDLTHIIIQKDDPVLTLVVADIDIDLAFDAPVLTQAHTLTVADIAHALAFDAPVLTQAHTLVVADIDIDLAFDGAGGGDGLWDIGAYIYPVGGGIILVQEDPDIVVADISLALAYEAPVLTQAHTLAVDNISIIQQYEYPTLTQAHTLVVADAALDLAFDAPVVTHNHMPVVLADITHALAFEAPVLTQAHVLAVNDAALALAFEAPVLTQAHTLVVADADIDLAFESPAVSEDVYELVVGTATVITLKAVIVT